MLILKMIMSYLQRLLFHQFHRYTIRIRTIPVPGIWGIFAFSVSFYFNHEFSDSFEEQICPPAVYVANSIYLDQKFQFRFLFRKSAISAFLHETTRRTSLMFKRGFCRFFSYHVTEFPCTIFISCLSSYSRFILLFFSII